LSQAVGNSQGVSQAAALHQGTHRSDTCISTGAKMTTASPLYFDAAFGVCGSRCSSLSCSRQVRCCLGQWVSMLATQTVKSAVTCKGPKGCQHADRHDERVCLSAFRYRCAACKQDFCGQCFSTPYHAELTCEEHKAPKCLYCQAPLLEEDSYMDTDR